MTHNTFNQFLKDFEKLAIGLEPTLDRFRFQTTTNSSGFPPYNITQVSEDEYVLSMALAGYSEDDLEITVQNDNLTVVGKIETRNDKAEVESKDYPKYLYRGIATRNFTRTFYIDPFIRVTGSTLTNGILEINFKYEVPEEKKPKKIAVNTVS